MKGRKRHLLVDTDGLVLGVFVLSADLADAEGADALLADLRRTFPTLELVWADSAYRGLVDWAQQTLGLTVAIVAKSPEPGFHVAPRRWVVERTFAWLGACRRLAKDFERTAESAEAWILLAMTRLMLRRLAAHAN